MDELNGSFGRLSTSAREWKPSGHEQRHADRSQFHPGRYQIQQPQQQPQQHQQPQQQQQQHQLPDQSSSIQRTSSNDWYSQDSELNAAKVIEFVPGRGWNTDSSGTTNRRTVDPQQQQQQHPRQHQQKHPRQQQQQQQQQQQRAQSSEPWGRTDDSYGYGHDLGVGEAGGAEVAVEAYEDSTLPAGPIPAPPPFRALHAMGMSDDLWRYHREISMESIRQMDPSDPRHKAVPIPYCNAYCLDDPSAQKQATTRSSFGYPSSTFQVTSREDGHLYCLRRFDNVKSVSPKIAAAVMDQWSAMDHPGLCRLDRCFVAQRAVFFVHQYIPGVRSLRDRWSGALSESVLWSAISQFVAILRRVHSANLAIRKLDLAHVLSKPDSSQLRLRFFFNCVGIVDALEFEARKPMLDLQRQDIRDLGRLILSMATGTDITPNTDNDTINRCERYCVQNFSRELHNLCFTLIRSPIPPTIVDVSRAMAGRALDELDSIHVSLDRTESTLAAEYDSGRALRLMLKLGFVNERPEFGPNRRWSQSGDCYVLTLFRDYVFHQADGAGNPVMDLGHVITALNKLDAADEEKIVLSSRDGKSVMVVSYADVARCLDSAYHELCTGAVPPSAVAPY